MDNMVFRNGFTLAEVLITLVIIGIIAAMTIPSLMNKTNEQETVVAVKKAYSVINQAYKRVVVENGEIIPTSLGTTNAEASTALGEMFAKQLNVQKICGTKTGEDCFSTENGGMYKQFDGSDGSVRNNGTEYKIRLSDGMSFAIYGYLRYLTFGSSEHLKNVIGWLDVDTNGDKGPNTYGKDLFGFYITKYGIIPFGTPDDTKNPFSNCRTRGNSCTAWVITKGNVDYWKKDVSW